MQLVPSITVNYKAESGNGSGKLRMLHLYRGNVALLPLVFGYSAEGKGCYWPKTTDAAVGEDDDDETEEVVARFFGVIKIPRIHVTGSYTVTSNCRHKCRCFAQFKTDNDNTCIDTMMIGPAVVRSVWAKHCKRTAAQPGPNNFLIR